MPNQESFGTNHLVTQNSECNPAREGSPHGLRVVYGTKQCQVCTRHKSPSLCVKISNTVNEVSTFEDVSLNTEGGQGRGGRGRETERERERERERGRERKSE